jgi:hypothetical protein
VEVAVAESAKAAERMLVSYFIVSNDVERSRRFYTEVLGGKVPSHHRSRSSAR